MNLCNTEPPAKILVERLLPKGEVTAMQKRDIARRIHQQAGILEYEAAKVLDRILELLKTTLQAGEPIDIQGYGGRSS